MSNSYAIVSDLAHRLGLVVANLTTIDEDLLQQSIDWGSAFVEDYTDRVFVDNVTTRFYQHDAIDPRDSHLLYLGGDIVQVSSVINGDGETIASDQYYPEPRNALSEHKPYYAIRLLSTSAFVWPTDGWVRVSGSWGYSTEPDTLIVGCTLRLAEYHYRSKAPLDTTTLFDGTVKQTMPQSFPTDVLAALDQRKRLAA